MENKKVCCGGRIKGMKEFQRLFQRGIRVKGEFISFQVLAREGKDRRVAFIASRKVGNAVRRNRAKRLMREAYRRKKNSIPMGLDIAIIADRGILKSDMMRLEEEMLSLVAQYCSLKND